MKPEELKVIAEGMGYISGLNGYMEPCFYKLIYTPCFYKLGGRHQEEIEYNPLTNNDQTVEIIGKLAEDNLEITYQKLNSNLHYIIIDGEEYKGKTINEAVCLAAYEHFKDK